VGRTSILILIAAIVAVGCRPAARPPRPGSPTPPGETIARWQPLRVERLPAAVEPPWEGPWGQRVEVWRLDLLEVDRPNLKQWLAAWEPGASATARRLTTALAPGVRAIPLSEPGAYVARAWDGQHWRAVLIIASGLSLALTLHDDDLEVFCVESPARKPVQGVFVKAIYTTRWRGSQRVLVASGTTDASGRWHADVVRDRFAPRVEATVIAARGSDYAVATACRTTALEPPARIEIHSIRHVVHPGQKAEVIGRLSRRVGGRAAPVGNVPVKIWLLRPDGVPLATRVTRTSAVGHFGAIFAVPRDARAGRYTVAVAARGIVECLPRLFPAFEVRHLPPEPFRLRVSANSRILRPGEELAIEVQAADAEGRPLPGVEIRSLTYGYPLSLSGKPAWLIATEPLDPSLVVPLPIALGSGRTDARGRLTLRWQPTRAEVPERHLLCAIELLADAGPRGTTSRTLEVLLLAEPPYVSIRPAAAFARPGEAVELHFTSPLPDPDQRKVRARCDLSYDDPRLSHRHFTIYDGTVAGLASRKLRATFSRPGRYEFTLAAGRSHSRSVVWVVAPGADIPWGGCDKPTMVVERPWARAGGKLLAVVGGTPRGSPIALTARKRSSVERFLVAAPTGGRCIELSLGPADRGPLEANLAQVADVGPIQNATRLWLEPGGSHLAISAELMWVRKREWSERGYRIATRSLDGRPVQSVVEIAFVRPTFVGSPPRAVRALRLVSHAGKATSPAGEIEVGFNEELLGRACGMFIEALSPDGRRGSALAFLPATSPALDLRSGRPRSPKETLSAIGGFGLDHPTARWLAAQVVRRHPEAAGALPHLVARARTGAEVVALVGLAAESPKAAAPTLEAALASGKVPRADIVATVAGRAANLRPILERLLTLDPSAAVRAAAARALATESARSLETLTKALLQDRSAAVREAAASALAGAGRAAVAPLRKAAAEESSPLVCVAIATSLARLGDVEGLLALLQRRQSAVVREALRSLRSVGYAASDGRLVRLVRSEDEETAGLAAANLVRSSLEGLEAVLAAARRRPREPLLRALAQTDSPQVVAAMRRWLRSRDRAVRLAAAECLARGGDEVAIGALRDFLADEATAQERERAALALIGAHDLASVRRLVALARAGKLGAATARALLRKAAQLGWQEAGPLAVEVLWRTLAHPAALGDPRQRDLWLAAVDAAPCAGSLPAAQVEAIVGTAPLDCPYREALAVLKRDGVARFLAALWSLPLAYDLRCHAVMAFARLEGKAAAPVLIPLLDSPALHEVALAALIEQGAAEALRSGLDQPSAVVRGACAAALGALADPTAAPRLRRLLADPDPFVRREAAHALATISTQAVFYKNHLGEQRLAVP